MTKSEGIYKFNCDGSYMSHSISIQSRQTFKQMIIVLLGNQQVLNKIIKENMKLVHFQSCRYNLKESLNSEFVLGFVCDKQTSITFILESLTTNECINIKILKKFTYINKSNYL